MKLAQRLVAIIFAAVLAGCIQDNNTGPLWPGAGDDLANPLAQPRVSGTYPPDGGVGPFDVFNQGEATKPHFVVRFSKLMNIDSMMGGRVRVEGFSVPVTAQPSRYETPYPFSDLVEFYIFTATPTIYPVFYEVARSYRIILDPSIVDINGNHLTGEYQFSFLPEPNFRVVSFNPSAGDSVGVQWIYPEIEFNSPVTPAVLPFVRLDPPIPGKWTTSEYDSSRISFDFLQPAAFGTEYTMTVSAGARDRDNHVLATPVASTFNTIPFLVSSAYPPDDETEVRLDDSWTAYFSGMIDTSTARASFQILPAISGALTVGGNYIHFGPDIGFAPSTRYTITISTSLRAWDSTSLNGPATFSFTTDAFRVVSVFPQDGQRVVSRGITISINANARLAGDPASAISITPNVQLSISAYGSSITATPTSSLAASTTYTVTISSSLQASGGYTLAMPYTFSFTTGK